MQSLECQRRNYAQVIHMPSPAGPRRLYRPRPRFGWVYLATLVESVIAGAAFVRGDWIRFAAACVAVTACAVYVVVKR